MTEAVSKLSARDLIVESVRRVYEKFPYPQYPLLASLRWEDGYAASSEFCAQLLFDICGRDAAIRKEYHSRLIPKNRTILVGGAGETLPYIMRQLEPSHHRLLCVDLSGKSLRRARLRLLTSIKKTSFIRQDLDHFIEEQGLVTGPYDHVDLYGVLHHMPNPSQTVSAIADRMAGDATMRVMVYNSESRTWIREVQAAIRDLRLDAFVEHDIESVRALLLLLASVSDKFAKRLGQMGSAAIDNRSWLVDSFMHPREARLDYEFWSRSFVKNGLQVIGVLDRYGELDDLPNPLWVAPKVEELQKRAESRAYQHNFEVYLVKRPSLAAIEPRKTDFTPAARRSILRFILQGPPSKWFRYDETDALPRSTRWRLWLEHCKFINQHKTHSIDGLVASIPLRSAQRLARIGAIMPGQIASEILRESLCQPIGAAHEAAPPTPLADLRGGPIAEMVMGLLQTKANFSDRRFSVVMQRLARAVS
jgi:hypothetical protein